MNIRRLIKFIVTLALSIGGDSGARAATCADPVSVNPQPTAGNCLYDVILNDRTGGMSAGTGVDHPVTLAMISTLMGGRQTLPLGGGRFLQPFGRSLSIRSWTSQRDYLFDATGTAGHLVLDDRGFTCVPARDMPPPVLTEIVRADGQLVGLQVQFDVDQDGDHLAVTIRIVARGDVYEDSAVELTTDVQNVGATEARLGLRYFWSTGMVGVSGIALGPVPPDPPTELWFSREGEWAAPEFDHLLASWTNAPSMIEPYYFGGISVNGPWSLDPPPTPPEVIVRSGDVTGSPPEARFGPGNTCFAWEVPNPPRGGPPSPGGSDTEALVYYWGRSEDSGVRLAPGESRSFTTWFWAFLENPVTCDAGGTGQVVECAGAVTPVQLDGDGSFTADRNQLLYRWSSANPAVTFDDVTAERPTALLSGAGVFPITLDVGIGPFTRTCEMEVEVADTTPPAIVQLSVDPSLLWPPNHRLVSVGVHVDVEDACDAAPQVRLVSVTSSEPDDATGRGDGHTLHDIQGANLGEDDRDLLLRAERDGDGAGRTYTLTYEVRDAAGNVATREVVVRVPHDMRGGATRLLPRARSPRR